MPKTPREVYTAEVAYLESRIGDIKTRIQMIEKESRFVASFYAGFLKGFVIGMVLSTVLLAIILMAVH
mgnify:CR=1 FL=1